MSINKHVINHRNQLMEVGGRETIPLERISTSLIHPSFNRATTYSRCLSFFLTHMITTFWRLRGNEISKQNLMISQRDRHKTRDKHRYGDITLLHIQNMLLFYTFLQIPAYFLMLKIWLPYNMDPHVHQNLSTKMVEYIYEIIVLSAQKDNPQGMVRTQHKCTATNHPLVDEKNMWSYHH